MANSTKNNVRIVDQFKLENSPFAVQKRELIKLIEEQIKKDENRIKYSTPYIPAVESTTMVFVGKIYTNAKSNKEKAIDKARAEKLKQTLKKITSQKSLMSFDKVIASVSPLYKDKFLTMVGKKIDSMSDSQKFTKFENYLKGEIQNALSVVRRDNLFSSKKVQLEQLNGVYVERVKGVFNKAIKDSVLDENQTKLYKSLLKNLESSYSKYKAEESVVDELAAELKGLMEGFQSPEIRAKIISVRSDLNAARIKLRSLKNIFDDAESRKKAFEQSVASQQIEKAVKKNVNIVYNKSKSVFDDYDFFVTTDSGEKEVIDADSTVAKQIDKVVSSFIMKFKSHVQNIMKTEILQNDENINKQFTLISNKLSDDFGKNIRDLKRAQKVLKSTLSSAEDEALKNELENSYLRLQSTEKTLITALKKMGVEIGEITAKK